MMKYTYKGVLAVVLSIFVATAFAQTATVNSDTTTTGTAVASGATATFTDPRDGKQYKTVVMPDGRTWFAQNLNYTKDLTFNMYANQANGKLYLLPANGVPAIGSYWCPGMNGSTYSGDQNTCNIYGALYTWETVMMVDGKYADETKTSSAWDNSWLAGNYYNSGSPAENPNADKNNARGGTNVKGGGRGICPAGWHIPTYREWAVMLDAVEGVNTHMQTAPFITNRIGAAGNLLKSAKITSSSIDPVDGSWYDCSSCSWTDPYGFNLQPGGYNDASPNWLVLRLRGTWAIHWTNSPYGVNGSILLSWPTSEVALGISFWVTASAASVRCIMDE